MEDGAHLLKWAPRVSRAKILRLYGNDAAGIVDEELIDEVAYAFYSRCQSISEVTEAESGRIHCPVCGAVFPRTGGDDEAVCCPFCGWRTTWKAFLKSYQGKQLSGGGAIAAFREYVRKMDRAETAKEKMLLIDWILHEAHKSTLAGGETAYWRPAAVNLIEGSMTRVTALLEQLANQPGYSPALQAAQDHWKEQVLPRLWAKQGRE